MLVRRAVRALLVDPDGAVLLMQLTDPSTDRAVWITPGGGLDDGETLHQFAGLQPAF
ncbi:MAG: NUDIX domain-containing protein [Acidimicrobiia bacterium]